MRECSSGMVQERYTDGSMISSYKLLPLKAFSNVEDFLTSIVNEITFVVNL